MLLPVAVLSGWFANEYWRLIPLISLNIRRTAPLVGADAAELRATASVNHNSFVSEKPEQRQLPAGCRHRPQVRDNPRGGV